MPTIELTTESRNHLIQQLGDATEYYRELHPRDHVDRSEFGVDKSTIRAFHGFVKPLATFNSWAGNSIVGIGQVGEHRTQTEFDDWYDELVASLDLAYGRQPLAAYQRHKLVDLYLKWACRCDEIAAAARVRIVEFGHCPLDSYSLGLLRNVAPGTVLNTSVPSMSVITSEAAYSYVQAAIREVCEQVP